MRGAATEFLLRAGHARTRLTVEADGPLRRRIAGERFVSAYPHDGRCGRELVLTRRATAAVFRWPLEWVR